MLNLSILQQLSKQLAIAPLHIIREYLEMETLHVLSQSSLAKKIIFYGGTSIRLAYHGPRFSEDLDFHFIASSGAKEKQHLEQVLSRVAAEHAGVRVEEVIQKRKTLFGLLHITHELLKHPIRIKIEISKRTAQLTPIPMLLTSPTTQREVLFRCADLASLLRLKEQAMLHRSVPRDWFDYWYLCQKAGAPKQVDAPFPFPKRAFMNDLKRWLPLSQWDAIDAVTAFYA